MFRLLWDSDALVFVVALAVRVILGIRPLIGRLLPGNLSTFVRVVRAVELGVLALFLAPPFLCPGHALTTYPRRPRRKRALRESGLAADAARRVASVSGARGWEDPIGTRRPTAIAGFHGPEFHRRRVAGAQGA